MHIPQATWPAGCYFLCHRGRLNAKYVAHDPPDDEQTDVGVERVTMKNPPLEPVQLVVHVIPAHEHRCQRIRNRENKEVIVTQGLEHMAMHQGMQGTLWATGRTRGAGEKPPRTLNRMAARHGGDKIIDDAQQNNRQCIGHYFVNLVEHDLIKMETLRL